MQMCWLSLWGFDSSAATLICWQKHPLTWVRPVVWYVNNWNIASEPWGNSLYMQTGLLESSNDLFGWYIILFIGKSILIPKFTSGPFAKSVMDCSCLNSSGYVDNIDSLLCVQCHAHHMFILFCGFSGWQISDYLEFMLEFAEITVEPYESPFCVNHPAVSYHETRGENFLFKPV